jgi:hypothetical protein
MAGPDAIRRFFAVEQILGRFRLDIHLFPLGS